MRREAAAPGTGRRRAAGILLIVLYLGAGMPFIHLFLHRAHASPPFARAATLDRGHAGTTNLRDHACPICLFLRTITTASCRWTAVSFPSSPAATRMGGDETAVATGREESAIAPRAPPFSPL